MFLRSSMALICSINWPELKRFECWAWLFARPRGYPRGRPGAIPKSSWWAWVATASMSYFVFWTVRSRRWLIAWSLNIVRWHNVFVQSWSNYIKTFFSLPQTSISSLRDEAEPHLQIFQTLQLTFGSRPWTVQDGLGMSWWHRNWVKSCSWRTGRVPSTATVLGLHWMSPQLQISAPQPARQSMFSSLASLNI